MSGFCYFIEGDLKSVDQKKITELGLGYAFDANPTCRELTGTTPSGHRGLLFGDTKRLGDLTPGYHPDIQVWREMPAVEGRPRLFIGYWKDHKPGPKDLQREQLVDGLLVKLGDGEMWQIPEIREYNEQSSQWECRLPSYLDFNATGRVIKGRPLAAYQELWDATAPLGSLLLEGGTTTDEDLAECAAKLLTANYAVSLIELLVLQLLTDGGDLSLIVMAACKKAKLMSWLNTVQKKSEFQPT